MGVGSVELSGLDKSGFEITSLKYTILKIVVSCSVRLVFSQLE